MFCFAASLVLCHSLACKNVNKLCWGYSFYVCMALLSCKVLLNIVVLQSSTSSYWQTHLKWKCTDLINQVNFRFLKYATATCDSFSSANPVLHSSLITYHPAHSSTYTSTLWKFTLVVNSTGPTGLSPEKSRISPVGFSCDLHSRKAEHCIVGV